MADGPKSGAKWSKYSVADDGTLVRNAEFCPSCGPGVFLANHKDRKSCGRCGHTVSNE
ncbi:MAG: 30S ribosomal protein S27ae [Euryarchaeota archaeon]|nr:30S ribosomal protein S27ae [Euryarchaeota archaeon]MBT5255546.1 30S ribosomal protein S27ae [Euryarchaeota archaeon]MDG1546316.1 30S ribosomal protein S27ae [Candidatus Poseidoniaceae archaeon]